MVNKTQSTRRFRIFLDVVMIVFSITFIIYFIAYLLGAYGVLDKYYIFGDNYVYDNPPAYVPVVLFIILNSYTTSTWLVWILAIFFLFVSLFQQKDNWSKIWPVLFTIFIIAFLSTELNLVYNAFFLVALFFYFKKYRKLLKSIEK